MMGKAVNIKVEGFGKNGIRMMERVAGVRNHEDADILFIVGDAWSEEALKAAEAAREKGILTVGISEKSCNPKVEKELKQGMDAFIVAAEGEMEKTACHIVKGVSDLLQKGGVVSLDLEDVLFILKNSEENAVRFGEGVGEMAVKDAVQGALKAFGEASKLQSAKRILISFTGNGDLPILQTSEAASKVQEIAPDAEVLWGTSVDDTMGEQVEVMLLANCMES